MACSVVTHPSRKCRTYVLVFRKCSPAQAPKTARGEGEMKRNGDKRGKGKRGGGVGGGDT
eukprot:3318127-Rhodomonas_salina.1